MTPTVVYNKSKLYDLALFLLKIAIIAMKFNQFAIRKKRIINGVKLWFKDHSLKNAGSLPRRMAQSLDDQSAATKFILVIYFPKM